MERIIYVICIAILIETLWKGNPLDDFIGESFGPITIFLSFASIHYTLAGRRKDTVGVGFRVFFTQKLQLEDNLESGTQPYLSFNSSLWQYWLFWDKTKLVSFSMNVIYMNYAITVFFLYLQLLQFWHHIIIMFNINQLDHRLY